MLIINIDIDINVDIDNDNDIVKLRDINIIK